MALVHDHQHDRAHDLSLCGLVLVVFAIIAVAIPLIRLAVDRLFALAG